ncbi:5307_t:CDS:1 [Paraglomus brasilianum]|uniref:5307_t:CDS:1 n=1 Tax=Paraglomus brasilianum TaxID=144538 RepID=A0A9N9FEM8_9GLOM|nr:5307_t:CDS:1 [Paraglomus brasilianum]
MASTTDRLTPHEHNLLEHPPYTLSIPRDTLIDPRRRQNNGQDSKPPRPSNRWILFRTNFASRLRSHPEISYNIQDVSRMASKEWQNQPILVKQYFNTLAKLARQWHKKAYPGYNYKPKRPKQNKKKNWLFREVNKDKFTKRGTDENNANEKKQKERRAGNQLDNSAQLNDNEQLQPLDECEQLPALDEFPQLNAYVYSIESEPVDPILNGYTHADVDEYAPPNEYFACIDGQQQQQHNSLYGVSESLWYGVVDNGFYGGVYSDGGNFAR